ncbi:MAG: TonB-dependent receptor, partial [Gammaproteobacteria bacterium]|nr:TonB-dependent receptor [Gammaproteobacteria bacterium]
MRLISVKGLSVTALGSILLLPVAFTQLAFAQDSADEVNLEEVITIGTRREARSAGDSPAPVDVISADELLNQGDTDLSNVLRTSVPSYNVNTQPISDAATIVRPANLRGLAPDSTLVLVNGKRRHRAAVISFLGGGVADGSQGPDISAIPAIAIKQMEVLRDGAASQYGSDAIAGVINFQLRDNSEGGAFEAQYGETYEGDGGQNKFAGNIGFPLAGDGFISLSGQYTETSATSRSVQRDDAAALIAGGNTAVANPAQIWGQPNVKDDMSVFFNAGIPLTDRIELYSFGNKSEREVEGGFFFRNPTNRGGVYAGPMVNPATGNSVSSNDNGTPADDSDDFFEDDRTGAVVASPSPSVRVGNVAGLDANACPSGIPLTENNGVTANQAVEDQVFADPNCFAFTEDGLSADGASLPGPGGFTPRFGGMLEDSSLVVGVRGDFEIGNGLNYDFSIGLGESDVDFFINNTINASLGPNTPRSFRPGGYRQKDTNFNADFSYAFPVASFASDLNVAFGYEDRKEEFKITAGDPASYAIGPLAAPSAAFPTGQGFSSSSNGFGGFTPASAGNRSQENDAIYVDAEADVTDQLVLQLAVRREDFDSFGTTTNYKAGGLFKVNPDLSLRSTFSTGFHAPTAGQANVTNVTTAFSGTQLVDQGTIPLSSAAGQFIADFIVAQGGTRPTL